MAKNILKLLLIPIISLSLSGFMGTFLWFKYMQPDIEYYSDGYYQKVGDISLGNIYLVNNGRLSEKDIAITLGTKVSQGNIEISYLTSPADIEYKDDRTVILINKLNPGEEAEINFKVKTNLLRFAIVDFTSESGNIKQADNILKSWWKFSPLQILFIVMWISLGFSAGFFISLKRNRNGI